MEQDMSNLKPKMATVSLGLIVIVVLLMGKSTVAQHDLRRGKTG